MNAVVVERLPEELGDETLFAQACQLPVSKYAAKQGKGAKDAKMGLKDLVVLLPPPTPLIGVDILAELFQEAEADCADIESALATLAEAKRWKALANEIMQDKVKPAYAVVLGFQAQIADTQKEQGALPGKIRNELFVAAKELFATYRQAGADAKWNALSEKLEKAVPGIVAMQMPAFSSKLEELHELLQLAWNDHALALQPANEFDMAASKLFTEYNAVMFKLGASKK